MPPLSTKNTHTKPQSNHPQTESQSQIKHKFIFPKLIILHFSQLLLINSLFSTNPRFRYFKQIMPLLSVIILPITFFDYIRQKNNAVNFELYCNLRAHELAFQNKVFTAYNPFRFCSFQIIAKSQQQLHPSLSISVLTSFIPHFAPFSLSALCPQTPHVPNPNFSPYHPF